MTFYFIYLTLQHFWPANQSQIYRELAALNEEGFVEQEVIEREDRLDKKLCHITDAGRASSIAGCLCPCLTGVFGSRS